jgi:hypothetical protein
MNVMSKVVWKPHPGRAAAASTDPDAAFAMENSAPGTTFL